MEKAYREPFNYKQSVEVAFTTKINYCKPKHLNTRRRTYKPRGIPWLWFASFTHPCLFYSYFAFHLLLFFLISRGISLSFEFVWQGRILSQGLTDAKGVK